MQSPGCHSQHTRARHLPKRGSERTPPGKMAEVVRSRMEAMVPELQDLHEKGLFTQPELRHMVKRRRRFEYLLKNRASEKADFLARAVSPWQRINQSPPSAQPAACLEALSVEARGTTEGISQCRMNVAAWDPGVAAWDRRTLSTN